MDDSSRMWITAVPPLGPEDVGVLLAVDGGSAEPGERAACRLLALGHEGEEGVLYLLPFDLAARYARAGDRLVVTLVAPLGVLDGVLDGEPAGAAGADTFTEDGAEWAVLLRRELVTDFVPEEQDGEKQAVLLIERTGAGDASPDALFALFEAGETGIAVLNAR
ncbi:hypothetical protein ACIQBJ_18360 [Kitasatospora sp. NPDC088391]|uniref:hypothetical protein n=1 Tax=Kitasatospora sp. NPDC088391 TaxID=3364074 RepID=UPI00380878B2